MASELDARLGENARDVVERRFEALGRDDAVTCADGFLVGLLVGVLVGFDA